MEPLIVFLVCGISLFVAASFWKGRRAVFGQLTGCEHCNVPWEELERIEALPYDVVRCPNCDCFRSHVHGVVSDWAYCPCCHSRTLAVNIVRHEDVHASEYCHACEYSRKVMIPAEMWHLLPNNVLRFPKVSPKDEQNPYKQAAKKAE